MYIQKGKVTKNETDLVLQCFTGYRNCEEVENKHDGRVNLQNGS